jgi:hypothetical protein
MKRRSGGSPRVRAHDERDTTRASYPTLGGDRLSDDHRHRGRGLPVYVRQIEGLRHAVAILILSGPDYQRYVFGLDLGAQGRAPNVMVSNGPCRQGSAPCCGPISRARYILDQCFEVICLSVPAGAFQYVCQTAGCARAPLEPGC